MQMIYTVHSSCVHREEHSRGIIQNFTGENVHLSAP